MINAANQSIPPAMAKLPPVEVNQNVLTISFAFGSLAAYAEIRKEAHSDKSRSAVLAPVTSARSIAAPILETSANSPKFMTTNTSIVPINQRSPMIRKRVVCATGRRLAKAFR